VKYINFVIVVTTAAIRRRCVTWLGIGCKLSDDDIKRSKHV